MDDMRGRRDKMLQDKEVARLRATYGDRLVRGIGSALKRDLLLADFNLALETPFAVNWPERIEDADGLVLSYVSKVAAISVAECIDCRASLEAGLLGIYGNNYLGLCSVDNLKIVDLVEVASSIEDAVVFYPKNTTGAIVVDCYPSNPGGMFSLFAQGGTLVDLLAECFTDGQV